MLNFITDSQCTRITPSDISYVGMIYYEEKGVEDLVTFASSKHLNALLEVNCVYVFCFIINFSILNLNTHMLRKVNASIFVLISLLIALN